MARYSDNLTIFTEAKQMSVQTHDIEYIHTGRIQIWKLLIEVGRKSFARGIKGAISVTEPKHFLLQPLPALMSPCPTLQVTWNTSMAFFVCARNINPISLILEN